MVGMKACSEYTKVNKRIRSKVPSALSLFHLHVSQVNNVINIQIITLEFLSICVHIIMIRLDEWKIMKYY